MFYLFWEKKGITCAQLLHIQLLLSSLILVLKTFTQEPVIYTSYPINDQHTGYTHIHTHTSHY